MSTEDQPAGLRFAGWCMKAVGVIFVMMIGAVYGISTHTFFDKLFSLKGTSGLMLASFIVGVPIAIGTLVGYLATRRRKAGLADASGYSMLAILLFILAGGAVLREGMVCIAMATPLFVALAFLGAIIGWASAGSPSHGPKLLSLALVAPLLAAPLEDRVASDHLRQSTIESIHIAAPPETVWRHLNHPLDIKPAELEGAFAYRIGVPYPIEARTLEPRVGGKRTLLWQRGVKFDEEITAWEPNRHVAWIYRFGPDSFPPGSLDDHIVIGGRYFDLEETSYTLIPERGGTRLVLVVGTRVTTNFNWYAGLWARFLVADTAQAILRFYKQRAEVDSTR